MKPEVWLRAAVNVMQYNQNEETSFRKPLY